ncbi:MBL fold metallo-hydrolase [Neobacillus sp. 179-C4.2 HS]|uniref:MBL fold metallo-hydrolase n=1 Tax=Neobacillus driksii TaxID=3035913 RepID=A0ABV4YUZ7_9BACI|nr:MBL fold metallo-hydrolase [Neobacillus sp. 179.-C4.2 HS]
MNSYLIRGDKGFTVIDTGSCAKESIEIWERILATGICVEKVILTHSHPDHTGLAGWFKERFDIPIFMSKYSYKELQKNNQQKNEGNKFTDFIKQHDGPEIQEKMMEKESAVFEFEPDGLFDHQQNIEIGNYSFETIWTPGHSPDHFCFFCEENGVMVIGDHILESISPIIGVYEDNEGNPLKEYFSSLEVIRAYRPYFVLPGHGNQILDLQARVNQIRNGHEKRLKQILQNIRDKEVTAGNLCKTLYGKGFLKVNHLGMFIATLARLVYLEREGQINSSCKDGKVVYGMY